MQNGPCRKNNLHGPFQFWRISKVFILIWLHEWLVLIASHAMCTVSIAVFLLFPIVKTSVILLSVLPILAYAAAFACFFRGFAHAGE